MGGSSSQVIGYRYYLGLHMAICHGPVDSINRIVVGERDAWAGPITASSTISVFKPDLFGGDEKEGGIVGVVDFMMGESTQTQNSYLQGQLGTDIPAFRGVVTAVFREGSFTETAIKVSWDGGDGQTFVEYQKAIYTSDGGGGFVAAMSPYPKKWAFEITDIPGGSFNVASQNINTGSANGAHIIYDALTNADWGLGLPTTDLDLTSFTTAGNTLLAEGFGLSMIYAQQSSVENFVKEVLDLINAVLFMDRATGRFKLALVRDDYTVADLPTFDEGNISALESFERPAFAELVNEVIIKYRLRGDINDTSITAQDLASIQAQNGIISQTKDFTGIDTADIAARIAMRELHQSSTPLARLTFRVNREAWDVNIGDVIKVSWKAYGITLMVVRVLEVDYGDLDDGTIKIDGVEDIFGLPANSYVTPSETVWADPVAEPLAALSQVLYEIPYYVLATTLTQAAFAEIDALDTFVQMVARKPLQPSFGLALWTRTGALAYTHSASGAWSNSATLTNELDKAFTGIINLTNFVGATSELIEGGYCYIGDEVLSIDTIDIAAGVVTVGRGCMDTVPVTHAAGSIIYFCQDSSTSDTTEREEGETIDARALTRTSVGTLALADATTTSRTLVGRQNRPYPPAQVQIRAATTPVADEYWPIEIIGPTITLTWTHQDRLQQLAGLENWYSIAVGSPEAGVTYTLRTYNDDTSTLLDTVTGLTGLTYTYTHGLAVSAAFNMRIELTSVRGGVESFQPFIHIVPFKAALAPNVRVTQQVISVLTSFTP